MSRQVQAPRFWHTNGESICAGLTVRPSLYINNCWLDFVQSKALKQKGSSVQTVLAVECQALLVEFPVIRGGKKWGKLMASVVASCTERIVKTRGEEEEEGMLSSVER